MATKPPTRICMFIISIYLVQKQHRIKWTLSSRSNQEANSPEGSSPPVKMPGWNRTSDHTVCHHVSPTVNIGESPDHAGCGTLWTWPDIWLGPKISGIHPHGMAVLRRNTMINQSQPSDFGLLSIPQHLQTNSSKSEKKKLGISWTTSCPPQDPPQLCVPQRSWNLTMSNPKEDLRILITGQASMLMVGHYHHFHHQYCHELWLDLRTWHHVSFLNANHLFNGLNKGRI